MTTIAKLPTFSAYPTNSTNTLKIDEDIDFYKVYKRETPCKSEIKPMPVSPRFHTQTATYNYTIPEQDSSISLVSGGPGSGRPLSPMQKVKKMNEGYIT